jgi:hypothetical protein
MKKTNALVYSILVIFLVIWVVWGLKGRRNLLNNQRFSAGIVTGFLAGGRGSAGVMSINFKFVVKGQYYNGSSGYSDMNLSSANFDSIFKGKTFPVIYDGSNPHNADILITPTFFKHFGVPFPDSLKWVLEYVNEK